MPSSKSQLESLQLQPRDFDLLRGLFESRVMTTGHVAVLYFDGRKESAKKRLQKLKAAGLVGERKRHVNQPSVLFLTRTGLLLFQKHGILTQ
jgi:predicted transcriptional regulator